MIILLFKYFLVKNPGVSSMQSLCNAVFVTMATNDFQYHYGNVLLLYWIVSLFVYRIRHNAKFFSHQTNMFCYCFYAYGQNNDLLLRVPQVTHSLSRLESVTNFTEFVKAFSQFGAEMIELAQLTNERQTDLKENRRRAQMVAARQVLDRSTMMLLTASKVRSFSPH